jgi:YggT family protein
MQGLRVPFGCTNAPFIATGELLSPIKQVDRTMFIIGNLFKALAIILHYVLNFYMWIVIARAVLSWVNPDPYNPIVRFLASVTDPVLYAIRRRLPVFFGGIDFSPMLVILAIVFLDNFLVPTLLRLAFNLGV